MKPEKGKKKRLTLTGEEVSDAQSLVGLRVKNRLTPVGSGVRPLYLQETKMSYLV
jgi:hypothetical protein